MISVKFFPAKKATVVLIATALVLSVGVGASGAAPALPIAITGHVTTVHPTSVIVTGTVNPKGTLTSWYFAFGLQTDTALGSRTVPMSAGSGKADLHVSGVLAPLVPGTSYRYHLVATSTVGTSYGADVNFNTSAAPVVITGAATNITTVAATLNGVVNPEALATNWYFQYGQSTAYGSVTAVKHLAAGANPTTVGVAIAGLAANATYHFRLVASSSAGTSYGQDLSLTTGLTITLNTSVSEVIFGGTASLTGTVKSGAGGATVTLLSQRFDQSTQLGVATFTTGPSGAWIYDVKPTVRTTYQVTVNGGKSSPVVISVAPAVFLSVVSRNRLSTRVVGAISFANHVLQLQRLQNGLWVTWKHVQLGSNGSLVFATSLPKGHTTIRMAIGPFAPGVDQAAPGYLAGYSPSVDYVRS